MKKKAKATPTKAAKSKAAEVKHQPQHLTFRFPKGAGMTPARFLKKVAAWRPQPDEGWEPNHAEEDQAYVLVAYSFVRPAIEAAYDGGGCLVFSRMAWEDTDSLEEEEEKTTWYTIEVRERSGKRVGFLMEGDLVQDDRPLEEVAEDPWGDVWAEVSDADYELAASDAGWMNLFKLQVVELPPVEDEE